MLNKCSKCKKEKDTAEFSKDSRNKNGLCSWCKQCAKEQQVEYRAKNKEKVTEYQAKYHAEHRAKNKERVKKTNAEDQAKNKERIAERGKNYYKKNKERKSEYYAEQRAKNKEKLAEYYILNKEKYVEYQKSPKGREVRKKAWAKYSSKPENQAKLSKRWFLTFICKDFILARDSYQCQLCSSKDKLIIHHIIPVSKDLEDKNILNPKNLVTLCPNCHKKAHNYNWKSLNLKIAQQLLTLIRAKEDIKPTILPTYNPEELAS